MDNKTFLSEEKTPGIPRPIPNTMPHIVRPEFVRQMNLELMRQNKRMAAVLNACTRLVASENLGQFFLHILDIFRDIRPVDRSALFVFDSEKRNLLFRCGAGNWFSPGSKLNISGNRLPESQDAVCRAAREGKKVYWAKRDSCKRTGGGTDGDNAGSEAVYAVPLYGESGCVGVVSLFHFGAIPFEIRETLDLLVPMLTAAVESRSNWRQPSNLHGKINADRPLIEKANKFSSLSSLTATIAHEIKNPMTSINTFLQLLPSRYKDEHFRNEFCGVAIEETNRINQLISELMGLVTNKKTVLENVDLHQLLDRMLLFLSPEIKKKEISLECRYDDAVGQVRIRPEKIRRAVMNIVMNAIAFTPKDGMIQLATRRNEKPDGTATIIIEVADSGPGVAPELSEIIFNANFSTRPNNKNQDGYGLGLFVALKSIEDLGGFIQVRNRENGGAAFIVGFPERPDSASTAAAGN